MCEHLIGPIQPFNPFNVLTHFSFVSSRPGRYTNDNKWLVKPSRSYILQSNVKLKDAVKNYLKDLRTQIVPLFLLTSLLLVAVGCHKDQVQVYRVADNQNQVQAAQPAPVTNPPNATPPAEMPAMGASGQMPGGVVPSDVQNAQPVKWTTPAGWTEVPPSEMRVGSFKIAGADGKTADVSIVPLPGMAGGDFANVNRWRGQVGLTPATDDVLQNSAENVQAGGQPAQLFDLGGASSRILGTIQHRDGTTWFIKMTGDPDLVEQQKPTFVTFLNSLSFGVETSQTQLPPGHPSIGEMSAQDQSALPPGHPPIGDMGAESAGPISHEGQPNWSVPAGWQEVSGGQFLVAKFMISGAAGTAAEVNISTSSGDGGGLAANVNRWRGQLGLAPINEFSTTTVEISGGDAQFVDLSGKDAQTGKPAEVIGVIVTQPNQTWFYKLMGDPDLVAAQKNAFMQFVTGVKY